MKHACILGVRIAVLALAAAFLLVSSASAGTPSKQATAAIEEGNARVEAELIFDVISAAAGTSFRAGVLLRMDPGWHVYWKNSGDAGFPTEIDWSSSDAAFGPLQYPAPRVFVESGGLATTYGYADEVLLFTDVVVGPEIGGPIRIRADLRFLVCEIRCVPGEIQLEAMLPVSHGSAPHDSSVLSVFDRFAARVPVLPEERGIVVETNYSVDSIRAGEAFELSIGVTACESGPVRCPSTLAFGPAPGEFAIDVSESLDLERVGTLAHPSGDKGALLVVRGRLFPGQAAPERIDGVLALLVDGHPEAVAISIELPDPDRAAENAAAGMRTSNASGREPGTHSAGFPSLTLPVALGLGLLGGLILNLMPCVLPVLALKAFRIAEAGGKDPHELRMQGSAFTLGVLLSMAALAAVVLGLRSAGEAVGWGFQFQHPGFIAFVAALLTVFALNLFGIYEITITPKGLGEVGGRSGATLRSFVEGGLAVLLATPCSAPFLGTAVGFAFAGSAVTVIVIFLAIGFGLALPYLAMSFIPGLASRLPRPGAWMMDLRSLLGFALLATVVWLLWIAGRSTGADGVIWLVAFLLMLGLLIWVLGRVQRARAPGLIRVVAVSVLMFASVGIALLPIDSAKSAMPDQPGNLRKWHAEDVRRVVAAGHPVLVDFTADWCLSCKVNEQMVLSAKEVEKTMDRLDVVRFRGDWTLRDKKILAELRRHGRAGVPLYLVYRPGSPDDPEILPEILTIGLVVTALNDASSSSRVIR